MWFKNNYADPECFERNVDYFGNDIKFVSALNILACQIECQKHAECNFWTFDTSSNGNGLNCWLKTRGDFKQKNLKRASGPKYCGKDVIAVTQMYQWTLNRKMLIRCWNLKNWAFPVLKSSVLQTRFKVILQVYTINQLIF